MSLKGTLEEFSAVGVLEVLASTLKTGAVYFTGEAECTAYLEVGQIYLVEPGRDSGAVEAAIASRTGVTGDDLAAARLAAGPIAEGGEELVRREAADLHSLRQAIETIMFDTLAELMQTNVGEFEFVPAVDHWIGPFRCLDVDQAVAEVELRIKEIDRITRVVPSGGWWVHLPAEMHTEGPECVVNQERWSVIVALGGARTVDDLAGRLGRPWLATATLVADMVGDGLALVTEDPPDGVVVHDPDHEPAAAFEPAPLAAPELVGAIEPWDRDPSAPAPAPGVALEPWGSTDAMAEVPSGLGAIEPFDAAPFDSIEPVDASWGEIAEIEPLAPVNRDYLPPRTDGGDPPGSDRHPNAVWLEGLYAQFIDGDAEPSPLQVAFASEEVDKRQKVRTLRRLVDAIRRM